MAQAQKIRVVDYVERSDGSRVRVDDLTGRERERFGTAVQCAILSAAFAGAAAFREPKEGDEECGISASLSDSA